MKVHLRQRKQTKSGSISLYLEIYKGTTITPDGKVKNIKDYEYLKLYLIDNPKTEAQKDQNKKTLKLAENIKAQRIVDIANGQYGFRNEKKTNVNFIDYFKALTDDRKQSSGNWGNWDSTLKHLVNYKGQNIRFKDIDEAFCKGFLEYLNKAEKSSGQPLSSASKASYFSKFRASLKEAVKKKIITSNPADDISIPKVKQEKREYLTIDEVRALYKTECRYDVLKRAFLFSCLTGLRWSDVNNLQWHQVTNNNGDWQITFNQQKTDKLQYLDVSEQARELLGQASSKDDKVFTGLKYSSYMNVELSKWVMRAGITKDITFHCARHTFAVLQLSLGTEIYTLSKLLGHSEIKTTQIYSDIIDQKKKEAANKIPAINI
jgi:integrase